jgi:uncharacterized protein (TIGR02246 family)
MNWIVTLFALLVLCSPSPTPAAPRDDVAAATKAWIEAMNSRDPEKVVALYDSDAILWGTVSPTLRDTPMAIRDYFKTLPTFPPEFRGVVNEERIRVYGDIAINSGAYTFSTMRDGKPATIPARFSFVYRNRDGRWLIVDHHSSAMPTPPQ